MKAENKEKFFKFLNKEISTECFENWMYQNENLENDLSVYEYIDFLSIKYKNDEKAALYVADLFFTIVDSDEFEDYKLLRLLNQALKNKEALEIFLKWSYDLYCYNNQEFEKLGMNYGIDLVIYEGYLEYPPPQGWDINTGKRIFTIAERIDIYREILRIKKLFDSGELHVNYEYKW